MSSRGCSVPDPRCSLSSGSPRRDPVWAMMAPCVDAQSTRYRIAKASFCSARHLRRSLGEAMRSARCHGPNWSERVGLAASRSLNSHCTWPGRFRTTTRSVVRNSSVTDPRSTLRPSLDRAHRAWICASVWFRSVCNSTWLSAHRRQRRLRQADFEFDRGFRRIDAEIGQRGLPHVVDRRRPAAPSTSAAARPCSTTSRRRAISGPEIDGQDDGDRKRRRDAGKPRHHHAEAAVGAVVRKQADTARQPPSEMN